MCKGTGEILELFANRSAPASPVSHQTVDREGGVWVVEGWRLDGWMDWFDRIG